MSGQPERWLAFAREDLQVAEILLEAGIHNQVCFHAQQCVEKAMKGILVQNGIVPPRVHSITELLRLLPRSLFADIAEGLVGLDDYYISLRYPDALPGTLPQGLPGRSEAQSALRLAREVLDRAKQPAA